MAAYDADRADVVGRMREEGIGAIVVGTNLATSKAAVELAEAHDGLWAAVAVHPGHTHKPHHDTSELAIAPQEEFFDEALFAKLVCSPKVVAMGETGLDFYRLPEGLDEQKLIKEKQRENFSAHINFAKKRGLPLSLHVRDAYDDALSILKEEKYFNGVMHCFTGNLTEAERFLDLGFYISFGGIVTFPPRRGAIENALDPVVRMVPTDRLLVETDAPWLAPAPLRGERNEPSKVRATARYIAKLRRMELDEIEQITKDNAVKLFHLAK